jgi:protein-disulfide isomerase
MESEVKTTYKMLKENNFKVSEIIFEGGVSVKDTTALAALQQWADGGKAFGVVHVIYFTPEGQQRVIDITAGKMQEEGAVASETK